MNERIRELRKTLGLNQAEFGAKLGIKQTSVAGYETGARKPMEAIINSICREFNVNEIWLRTGTGEMFNDSVTDSQIMGVIRDLGLDGIAARFVNIYLHLSDSEQDVVRRCIRGMLDNHPVPVETPPETQEEKIARLERENDELKATLIDTQEEEWMIIRDAEERLSALLDIVKNSNS